MAEKAARPLDPEAVRIGRILRAIRDERGLTQKAVAEQLPIDEGAYGAWEAGRSRFTLADVRSIAHALGVDTPYLSRRLGLCGDGSDVSALLAEFAGPEIGHLVAQAVTRFPSLDGDKRAFLLVALRSL